ncbi:hypothetical protein UlMin_030727 [Ulmus minor]
MLEANPPFIGVRFVLVGFDLVTEQKVRSKLLDGGGVDAGQYSENCTHVIVDKIIYDDPICVAARKERKTLVTGLWVDHSFDIGMPVDATSIMYRPPKDLNGIPGAKSLIMCLTGYQRQDRDDIMTMVSLMGAQFSKPLVANKVTHLICYKFEGEKYELAKKLTRIKLVNHRWLEDCLRDWEILPEVNYNKSGYEMETLEAEAKDSEEEAEDPFVKQYALGNMHRSPCTSKIGVTEASKSPKLVVEAPESALPNDSLNFNSAKDTLSVRGIENRSDQASTFDQFSISKDLSYQGGGDLKGATYGKLPDLHYQTPDGKNARNNLMSNSRSAEKPPLSDGKSISASYSRKTSRRIGEFSSNGSGFGKESMSKHTVDDDPFSFFKRMSSNLDEAPQKGIDFHSGEESTGFLPQKRMPNGPYSSPKLQKISNDASPCIRKSPAASDNTLGVQPTSFFDTLHETNNRHSPISSGHSLKECANLNPFENSRACDVMTKSKLPLKGTVTSDSGPNDNADEKTSPFAQRLKMTSFSSIPDGNNFDMGNSVAADVGVPQNHQEDVEDLAPSKTNADNYKSPASFDLVGNGNTATKLPRKKMVAKKTLGSRLNLASATNQKGSIYLDKSTTQNDPSTSSTGPDFEKISGNKKLDISSPIVINEAPRNMETEDPTTSRDNAVPITERMDDETETPEDTVEAALEKVTAEESCEAGALRKKKSEGLQCLSNDNTANVNAMVPKQGMEGAKPKNVVEKNISGGHASKRKKNKEEARTVGKTKGENAPVVNEVIKAKEHVNGEKTQSGNSEVKEVETEKKAVTDKAGTGSKNISQGDGSKRKNNKERTLGISRTKKVPKFGEVVKSVDNVDAEKMQSENSEEKEMETVKGGVTDNAGTEPDNSAKKNTSKGDSSKRKKTKERACVGKTKTERVPEPVDGENMQKENSEVKETETEKIAVTGAVAKIKRRKVSKNKSESSMEVEKENMPIDNGPENKSQAEKHAEKTPMKPSITPMKINKISTEISLNSSRHAGGVMNRERTEPKLFIFSGNRFAWKEFQKFIRRLKGRCCRYSHQWSYQATHFIAPDPIKRKEKFFAAAASGRWILKTDYLTASNEAGRFLEEEPYEWHENALNEDGAINLEAPRKWRLLRERTGHGAFYGMRVIIYGECIAPSLDTMKRVVKAGDGTILATSPPYTRFLDSGIDFAIITPGMPRVDLWVQEFLKHEIPCVVADYLVEYVCKPGYSLDKHVLYNTHAWAEKSFAKLQSKAEEIVEDWMLPPDNGGNHDMPCQVCGSRDRAEVMLICGDESGSKGCGVGCHIDCCNPPFEDVPEEDWFCSKCIETKSSFKSSKKGKKRSSLKSK